MSKYCVALTHEGQYEDYECIHSYIAEFPDDASEEEIEDAIGKHETLPLYKFTSTQKRVFRTEK